MIPMKIPTASKLSLIATLALAGLNSVVAQNDEPGTKHSIDLPLSTMGVCYYFGSRPKIYVEIDQSGDVWWNGNKLEDLSVVDELLRSRPTYDDLTLRIIFRCDRLAPAERFSTIISRVQKQTELLDVLLAVKIEQSDREYHIGAALLHDKADKAKAHEVVTGSASSPNAEQSTSSEEIEAGPEIFRLAVNADDSFTTDGEDLDKVEFLDHWQMVDAAAKILNEELHVYAEFDQDCTFQHVVNLLDTAAAAYSNEEFKFSISETTVEEK